MTPKPRNPAEPRSPACKGVTPRSSFQMGIRTPMDMNTMTFIRSMPQRTLITTQA